MVDAEVLEEITRHRERMLGKAEFERQVETGLVQLPPKMAKARRQQERRDLRAALREARLQSILAAEIGRMPREEIAARFGVKTSTIPRLLKDAQRAGLMEVAKDLVLGKLVPKAIGVYEVALEANSLEAARDVMRGTGLLPEKLTDLGAFGGAQEGEITIREYRARLGAQRSDNNGRTGTDEIRSDEHSLGAAGERGVEPAVEAEYDV